MRQGDIRKFATTSFFLLNLWYTKHIVEMGCIMKQLQLKQIVYLLCVIFFLAGCSAQGGFAKRARPNTEKLSEIQFAEPHQEALVANIQTSVGKITAVLFPQYAPMAVENFAELAKQGYYNGVSFHRVEKDFLIQTGDASATGTGGTSIWNHLTYPNEISTKLHHYSGALAVVHAQEQGIGNLSQFYIVTTPPHEMQNFKKEQLLQHGFSENSVQAYETVGGLPALDGKDTVFGQVIEGMDVVDAINQVQVDDTKKPKEPIVIEKITITTYSKRNEL